ncbi:unnamed protein product [Symbiodinium sp. CCMP2592]|nr:unnamed protein product [Symbiodinium sp. CCMP2592]
MSSIEVQPYFEEPLGSLAETVNNERFIELPLCEIKQKHAHLPGGEKFIQDSQANQTGKTHPQTSDPEWRI